LLLNLWPKQYTTNEWSFQVQEAILSLPWYEFAIHVRRYKAIAEGNIYPLCQLNRTKSELLVMF